MPCCHGNTLWEPFAVRVSIILLLSLQSALPPGVWPFVFVCTLIVQCCFCALVSVMVYDSLLVQGPAWQFNIQGHIPGQDSLHTVDNLPISHGNVFGEGITAKKDFCHFSCSLRWMIHVITIMLKHHWEENGINKADRHKQGNTI